MVRRRNSTPLIRSVFYLRSHRGSLSKPGHFIQAEDEHEKQEGVEPFNPLLRKSASCRLIDA